MLILEKWGLKDFFGFRASACTAPKEQTQPIAYTPDFYEILGVSRQDNLEQIKERWRALANIYHPDKMGDANKMAEINEAYHYIVQSRKI